MAYSLNQHKPRPDIKVGFRLNDNYADTLLPRIKELLRHKHQGFPGSQPVDFESRHIELLGNEDYFVRDKTDGKRYIMFFTAVDGGTAFMMDELCKFRILTGFKLPLRSNPSHMHNETMMDGEVVMDMDDNKQCLRLRYLIFDLMVLNGSVLIERPYSKRMGMLRHDVLEPLNAVLEKNVEMKKKMPFTMEIKPMELSYGLKHENDGLIFVPVNHPYEPGTCKKLLLWKPITQLAVDFMIRVLYFKGENKPIYQLFVSDDRNHKFYDHLTLEPDIAIQWQGNPPDGTVATFWYDKHWKTTIHHEGMSPYSRDGGWRFIRFVYEKHTADHERIVERVWKSIQNAVSQDMLEKQKPIIRDNWKRRQAIQLPGAQPLPSPTSQIQTPLINSIFGPVSSSIPSQIYLNNDSNNNTQLVSPSVSSSEPFALLKERRSFEEQIRDQNIKNEPTESMEAITRSKFSQMLVTSPGIKSPAEESCLPCNNNGEKINRNISYFSPIHEKKLPDQADQSRPDIDISLKQKEFQNGHSQAFETPLQKKSPDQCVSSLTCVPLDNSMVSPKNRLEKRSDDIRDSSNNKRVDPMETSEEIIQPEPEPSNKTSSILNRDHSPLKSDAFSKDPEVLRRNNIIKHSSKLLEQSDEESNDEADESNEDDEVEQASSDDDLSQKEHHRMSISSAIMDHEPSGNLSEQNRSNQGVKKFNLKEEDEDADPWDQQESHESPISTKDQNCSRQYSEDDLDRKEVGYDSSDSIEENKPPIQVKTNMPSQIQLPASEQSQSHQNISSREQSTPIPIRNAQNSQHVDSFTNDIQPIKQIQSQSILEQDSRPIPKQSPKKLPDSENILQVQLQNNNQVVSEPSRERIPEVREISFHPNVSLQKIQDNNRSKPLQLQNNMTVPIRPLVSIQENRTVPYNNVRHASTQIISPVQVIQPTDSLSRGQIEENNILSTSPLQRYQVPDNRSNSTQIRASNQEIQPLPVHSQLSLHTTNRPASVQTHQIHETQAATTHLISPTQNIHKISPILQDNLPTSNINTQSRYQVQQESRQTPTLTPPQLPESRQVISQQSLQILQESRSTTISQQPRRQTISDNRSSQPRQIQIPHSLPIQMQENRLMNPPQTQIQLTNSRSIPQSQVTTQEMQPQTLSEYQQISSGQYIDRKQWDSNTEYERFTTSNHNNPNLQQALRPMTRRHTLSGTNNSSYQQNAPNSYQHQRHISMMVSSYPSPRQETLSSSIPSASQPMSPPQHGLPLRSPISTIPQGLNILSQIPEEFSNINNNDPVNVRFANFTHNPSQSYTQQQQPQAIQQNVTNSNVPPVLRPTPQKRKSKGALDFILNSGGGSNQKRSKYDDEDNDAEQYL